jgi:hypothetical protein
MNHRISMLCVTCVLALAAEVAQAEVFQCLDADGHILLTDGGCPPGYTVNLVVGQPRSAQADEDLAYREEAEQRIAAADAERRAAEAEAARLRAQLDAERMRDGSAPDDRIEALDRKLDELLERPQVYGGAALVPVPALPLCGPAGRPWVDCRPHPRPRLQPLPKPQPQAHRPGTRDLDRDRCGTFGCTPGITHAPWDDERRRPDRWPQRWERR